MKVEISKTSDWNYKETKNFKNAQSLLKFIKEKGGEHILSFNIEKKLWELEIYDDYRE